MFLKDLLKLYTKSSNWSLPTRFSNQIYIQIYQFPHIRYMFQLLDPSNLIALTKLDKSRNSRYVIFSIYLLLHLYYDPFFLVLQPQTQAHHVLLFRMTNQFSLRYKITVLYALKVLLLCIL